MRKFVSRQSLPPDGTAVARGSLFGRFFALFALLVSTLLFQPACGDSAEDVLGHARAAAEAGDFEEYTEWFTKRSRDLLRGLQQVSNDTRRVFQFMEERDLIRLLPEGDVWEEERRGNLTILRVGRSERAMEDVLLFREVEGWRIDILHSDRFWRPLIVTGQQP